MIWSTVSEAMRAARRIASVGFCLLLPGFDCSMTWAQERVLVVDTPMEPPEWALLQRQLLDANSQACRVLARHALDDRGYLLHVPRWGVIDGPDDAIETFSDWPLLHSLGADDSVLEDYKRAQEGHWLQYGELRTVKTDLARDGAYFQEFITMSDWAHTREGMQPFMSLGLSEPNSALYRKRMARFAGLYMNEDPSAPNYDPVRKLIRSTWTGSKGPMLREPTVYDWVGDPVRGRFHFLHSSAGLDRMLDFAAHYPKMLAHCQDYKDGAGDSHLNLSATNLALNAYMLTGKAKYRHWLLEYVDAWKERTRANHGFIPTKVGLDGRPGGESGQWWKGLYGWNFSNFDAEVGYVKHRGTIFIGTWDGFGNAFLLTGDPGYLAVMRQQLMHFHSRKRVVDGKTLIPKMYGDPRGHTHTGKPEWYAWTEKLNLDRWTELYLWGMDRADLEPIPKTGWIGFLEGSEPGYPARILREDLERVRSRVQAIRDDPTTPDTRLPDWFMHLNPSSSRNLASLMTGAYLPSVIWSVNFRLRYFDPERRRAGVPPDVGALIQRMSGDSVTVTLVNLNPVAPRTVVVQAGGYGEHQFTQVERRASTEELNGSFITVRLEPGCGARLTLGMNRYANAPTLLHPRDR